MLLVGNAPNLHRTPPGLFDYPSIGMNTIHKYLRWKPTYYTAVDHRVMREFGRDIEEKYRDVYKFIPSPNLDEWKGDNSFIRFYHRPGEIDPFGDFENGITFSNVMHVAMQLAYWMGARIILMIGVQHNPDASRMHFWGVDDAIKEEPPLERWFADYKTLSDGMKEKGVSVVNISVNTSVPEDVLMCGDWKDWR